MILQAVIDIAEICARKGVQDIVLSPGSRCAPLTLAFARHPQLRVRTVPDERSAAFIGLGIAQQTGLPVVLVCTSGTAAYNYAPAVAEAFYQHIPLLVLTADRPPEWIDQLDGQTIRQSHIYGGHVKRSLDFPVGSTHTDDLWFAGRLINEGLNEVAAYPPGPVHINIPLREPFYPEPGEEFAFSQDVKVIAELPSSFGLAPEAWEHLKKEMQRYQRVLVVAGQNKKDEALYAQVKQFCQATGAVFVTDAISNQQVAGESINYHDVFLGAKNVSDSTALAPDLLITFHKSLISKNLKLFLRKQKQLHHWHIQPAGMVADTFQALTQIIRTTPQEFFRQMAAGPRLPVSPAFAQAWFNLDQKGKAVLEAFQENSPFSEFQACYHFLRSLPAQSQVHLANSMSVRYANLIGVAEKEGVEVFANRGTSGIDGSTSTAVGAALSTDTLVTLLTGDMAFLYDRNALWHNYLPQNLRILVLNNHGGGIFRMLEGPRSQPELRAYFETDQRQTAQRTAEDMGLQYHQVTDAAALTALFPTFFDLAAGPQLIEVVTDSSENFAAFSLYKEQVAKISNG
ncbi:2-succinyl-5-enolpyruvyl-6-hydroxy-3-cyclohexene-1-carboxylic-acid synthase [Rufibacter glacialis]|uniref:2-succinyl-5-enolpyruvyl-6-hydroxy-3-cyclohexene-1-carboxylate synthase n=1 Tax=Rufibacter glacialis TaxID=1259555 RepID=A0A5M8QIP9_9BACT|nr:2-succinyl-5-enolpyruvyl-6-hydroxy-3-cyclohexene-1-carboxylic-acid synthase [Rufibacter glacialis]KAA6434643.1 2-succinyl-5-enolpyruvyl-6-hydroxy-3-cyclohexene-1-carboxylic-acid synthase [Rufibacter glacialis]GGK71295.1 2-succinyl-5-enolpyruvyl-6-hydroxy-3-cyclohexene-1-carboxylate synthase [Rufibacter glacialis]